MSDERYMNFDAARGEQRGTPIRFTVGGQEFTCPPLMPAGLVLAYRRIAADGDPDKVIPDGEIIGLLEYALGSADYDRLLKTGIPYFSPDKDEPSLLSITFWVMERYRMPVSMADEGNAPSPEKTGQIPSSKTGDSSKQTSSENTE